MPKHNEDFSNDGQEEKNKYKYVRISFLTHQPLLPFRIVFKSDPAFNKGDKKRVGAVRKQFKRWERLLKKENFSFKGYRGYRTKKGAAKKLRNRGEGTLLDTVINVIGEPIHVAKARPGDIVMQDAWSVGICNGKLSAFIGEEGIIYVRTLDCTRAFRNG